MTPDPLAANVPPSPGERRRKLRAAYGRAFSTEDGRTVLTDLLASFGFSADGIEKPSAQYGANAQDVFLREGMKEPVRRILAFSSHRLSPGNINTDQQQQ